MTEIKLHLEDWEVGMIISALAELPRDLAGETIRKIQEQAEADLIHCRECEHFDQEKRHPMVQMVHDLIGCDNQPGICKRTSAPTEANGYCHKAKRRPNDS